MRRKLILFNSAVLLLGALALTAQTPAPTLSANAQAFSAACVAMGGAKLVCDQDAILHELAITGESAYKSTVSAQFTADEAKEAGDHAADLAVIGTLQTQLAAQAQAIATMQTQIQALQPAAPSPVYALAFSPTPDRANAVNLNGATVKGMLYVFTAAQTNIPNFNPAGIGSVCYMLDGKAVRPDCESQTPYDFIGGAAAALPWSSATVVNGPHSVTQKVTTLAGITETDIATFTVAN